MTGSLDSFVSDRQRRQYSRWADRLPAEVVDEITASTVGAKTVAAWLRSIGYDDATPGKVETLIRERNGAR